MSHSKLPAGWDRERVQRVMDHYDNLTEDEWLAEDEAAAADTEKQVVITVPRELLPAIRELLAAHQAATASQ